MAGASSGGEIITGLTTSEQMAEFSIEAISAAENLRSSGNEDAAALIPVIAGSLCARETITGQDIRDYVESRETEHAELVRGALNDAYAKAGKPKVVTQSEGQGQEL